jgi:transposase-like protein
MGRKSRYSDEFRAEAVRLSREPGQSSETVGADLGMSGMTIRNWRKEFEATAAQRGDRRGPPLSARPVSGWGTGGPRSRRGS